MLPIGRIMQNSLWRMHDRIWDIFHIVQKYIFDFIPLPSHYVIVYTLPVSVSMDGTSAMNKKFTPVFM